MNQADCQELTGCSWTVTNISNATSTLLGIFIIFKHKGTCENLTKIIPIPILTLAPPTYCGSIENPIIACAGTIGCAYLNNTCQIFAGCQAYIQNSNSACQSISKQCTTDGIRCVLPGSCNSYLTYYLCTSIFFYQTILGNIATSGSK